MFHENLEGYIRGVLARGYCYGNNSKKILDPELLDSICKEIEKDSDIYMITKDEYEKHIGCKKRKNIEYCEVSDYFKIETLEI